MRKSIIITVCAVIAAAVAAAGLRYYITYKRPNIQQDYVLLVHDGMTYEAMMDSIIFWMSIHGSSTKHKCRSQ